MPWTVAEDFRTMDPVSYIRSVGLRPEDSYGFVPTKLKDGGSSLFLYRERPEYEQARAKLPAPEEAREFGPIRIEPSQEVEIEYAGGDLSEALDQGIAEAERMQRAWGSVTPSARGAPADTVKVPDPKRLERLAKLRESGAISDEEYAKLAFDETTASTTSAGQSTSVPSGGAPIVAHRLYPGIRWRNSGRQLNDFLPRYVEIVGVGPTDVYGVFPRRTYNSDNVTEWDDYLIVYRDRPEYEAARESYAAQADKKGRWPPPMITPGVGDAPPAAPGVSKLAVEREGWPRKALVVKEKGRDLAESIREKISRFGYEPEDSFGFCPSFTHRSIYYGWRKR